jgi:hypothetical protein
LSYPWGPNTPLHEIEIDGKSFYVRDNLYRFLTRLTIEYLPCGYTWTDAIRINKNDFVEKTAQVRMMCSIFQHTYEVLVRLSEEDESCDLIMNLALAHEDNPKPIDDQIRGCVASSQYRIWKALNAF